MKRITNLLLFDETIFSIRSQRGIFLELKRLLEDAVSEDTEHGCEDRDSENKPWSCFTIFLSHRERFSTVETVFFFRVQKLQ